MSGYNTRSKVNFMAYTPFCDKLIELHHHHHTQNTAPSIGY